MYPQGELQSLYHWCLKEIHGWNRAEVYLRNEESMDPESLETWERTTMRLEAGMPVQYVFGSTTFFGLEFKVDNRVLIPRPETEELIALVLKRNNEDEKSVVDFGTGSGCIAIAIKFNRPNWRVVGVDVSMDALDLAHSNSIINNVQVEFQVLDILNFSARIGGDIWVSNPPYISTSDSGLVDDNVMKFEPHLALFAPSEDPFVFFKVITAKALEEGVEQIYFETHATEMDVLSDALSEVWSGKIERVRDAAQKERFLVLSN